MYIAHYKSVNSTNEFYTEGRDTLDYPTQVKRDTERYSLDTTYLVSGKSQLKSFINTIQSLNIELGVDLDSI